MDAKRNRLFTRPWRRLAQIQSQENAPSSRTIDFGTSITLQIDSADKRWIVSRVRKTQIRAENGENDKDAYCGDVFHVRAPILRIVGDVGKGFLKTGARGGEGGTEAGMGMCGGEGVETGEVGRVAEGAEGGERGDVERGGVGGIGEDGADVREDAGEALLGADLQGGRASGGMRGGIGGEREGAREEEGAVGASGRRDVREREERGAGIRARGFARGLLEALAQIAERGGVLDALRDGAEVLDAVVEDRGRLLVRAEDGDRRGDEVRRKDGLLAKEVPDVVLEGGLAVGAERGIGGREIGDEAVRLGGGKVAAEGMDEVETGLVGGGRRPERPIRRDSPGLASLDSPLNEGAGLGGGGERKKRGEEDTVKSVKNVNRF